MIKEDMPGMAMGNQGIAGGGLEAGGEPGVPVKVQRKIQKRQKTPSNNVVMAYFRRKAPMIAENTFAGAMVFEVSPGVFHAAKMEKRKGKHWRTYLDECDELSEIREKIRKEVF